MLERMEQRLGRPLTRRELESALRTPSYDRLARLRKARQSRNPLTRSEALVVAKRAQHSLREARGLDGYPSSLVYAGRAAAYRDVVQDFTARRNPLAHGENYEAGLAMAARAQKLRLWYNRKLEAEAVRLWRRLSTVPILPDAEHAFRHGFRVGFGKESPNPRRPSGRYSPAARAFLGGEVPALVAEGYPPRRAVAAALDMARRAGLKVPARRNPAHHPKAVQVARILKSDLGVAAGIRYAESIARTHGPSEWEYAEAAEILREQLQKKNPLTRVETAAVLQQSRRHLREARALVGKHEPFRQGLASGYADAEYSLARRYGEARGPYQTRPLVRNPPWPMAGGYRVGDRVTFRDRFGKDRTGRVVFAEPAHLVLNTGGAHGTPRVVRYDQVVKVSPRRNPLMLVNPRGLPRVVATLPASQLEVRYRRHGAHAGDYRHTFKRGVKVYGLADGSVLIRGTKPAWNLQ